MAADVALPVTLTNGTANDATQVMADLNAIITWINANALHIDASKATTGTLAGPAADPTTSNQYSRKAYVDNLDLHPPRASAMASRAQTQNVANATSADLTLDTEQWDVTANFFTAPAINLIVPAGYGGVYICVAGYLGPTSGCIAEVKVNGVTQFIVPTATGLSPLAAPATKLLLLAAGDQVKLTVTNNFGSAQNFGGYIQLHHLSA